MKLVTKLVTASILALSAVAPALAAEGNTLLERNTYQHVQADRSTAHRAIDAMAFASAPAAPAIAPAGNIDLGIGSQS